MDLSIVIPAFNEERNIARTIKKVFSYLETKELLFEIIVVDDGSEDKTKEIVQGFVSENSNIFLIENEKNFGKGYSVKRGILAAKGETILFTDADLSISIEYVDTMRYLSQNGSPVAIASRYTPGAKMVYPKKVREKMGRIFNKLVKAFINLDIEDTQCGFKVFDREAAKNIFENCTANRFAFDVEVLSLAREFGYKISEVPVECINSPTTSVRLIRDPLNMLKELLLIKLNKVRRKVRSK